MADTTFAERLTALAGDVPDETAVLALQEQTGSQERGVALAHRLAESLGWAVREDTTSRRRATTLLRDPERGRMTVYRDSGAVALRTSLAPFDELFDKDPGDEELIRHLSEQLDGLHLVDAFSAVERLDFERLWRIRAAGSDPGGAVTDPVLCRAVGAFRHRVRDLPVLGRASAHVEMTGHGTLSSMSATLRTPADRGSQVLATIRPRDPRDAADEVASRVTRALGGQDIGDEVTPRSFTFGYLSLGRRRAQAVLAPFFVAELTIGGGPDRTRSAHLVPVAGSVERYLGLPRGAAPTTQERKVDAFTLAG